MKRLVAVVALVVGAFVVSRAEAGEKYIGVLVSDGGEVSNETTTTPFFVPTDSKLTLWCTATTYVLTDSRAPVTIGGANPGLYLSSNTLFPTSTGTQVTSIPDGGVFDGGWAPGTSVANGGALVRAISSSGATHCFVYGRRGNE